jgi:hypothetical protein
MPNFFEELFLKPYMYVGLVVGVVLTIILFMTRVLKPGVKNCVKEYPDSCTDNANLIPEGSTCTPGPLDFCKGGLTCNSSGKCVKT